MDKEHSKIEEEEEEEEGQQKQPARGSGPLHDLMSRCFT